MKQKNVTYESPNDMSQYSLVVDTGYKKTVQFYLDWGDGDAYLSEENVKELVEQLTTWLGYMAMENG